MSHPTVVRDKIDGGYQQFDLFSRLLEDRVIYIDTDFNDYMASLVCAQLLVLSNKSEEEIKIHINSPGGSVISGLAIYDTMQMIPNTIKTVAIGHACSMGAYILSAGTKGHRYATPSSRVMIHQVSGGNQGTTLDINIMAKEQNRLNDYLDARLAVHCGKTVKQIKKATERDNFMTADEAVKFGIIDKVLSPDNSSAWK